MKNKTSRTTKSRPLNKHNVMRSSKLLARHSRECFALKAVKDGTWDTPWSGCIDGSYWGTVTGSRRHGHILWYQVTCNDPHCKARKAVSSEVLNYA
jgi:hypothetical protein